MIDSRETEVLSWAVKIADDKSRAEEAVGAGNQAAAQRYRADADAARIKLASLGYPWIAEVLSADGANAGQTRTYVQSLRIHLDRYDPSNTPPLTMQAAMTMGGSSGGGGIVNWLGGLGAGAGQISAGARQETVNWLAVVQSGTKILFPVMMLWGFVKVFRIRAHVGRG